MLQSYGSPGSAPDFPKKSTFKGLYISEKYIYAMKLSNITIVYHNKCYLS